MMTPWFSNEQFAYLGVVKTHHSHAVDFPAQSSPFVSNKENLAQQIGVFKEKYAIIHVIMCKNGSRNVVACWLTCRPHEEIVRSR